MRSLRTRAPGRKAIGNRWFFKIMRYDDRTIEKFKARYVGIRKFLGAITMKLLRLLPNFVH